jgi:hypothetical protein
MFGDRCAASFASVSADLKDVQAVPGETIAGTHPLVLLPFENPYLLTSIPNAAAFLATFSSSLPSEIAAREGALRRNRHHRTHARERSRIRPTRRRHPAPR